MQTPWVRLSSLRELPCVSSCVVGRVLASWLELAGSCLQVLLALPSLDGCGMLATTFAKLFADIGTQEDVQALQCDLRG